MDMAVDIDIPGVLLSGVISIIKQSLRIMFLQQWIGKEVGKAIVESAKCPPQWINGVLS